MRQQDGVQTEYEIHTGRLTLVSSLNHCNSDQETCGIFHWQGDLHQVMESTLWVFSQRMCVFGEKEGWEVGLDLPSTVRYAEALSWSRVVLVMHEYKPSSLRLTLEICRSPFSTEYLQRQNNTVGLTVNWLIQLTDNLPVNKSVN